MQPEFEQPAERLDGSVSQFQLRLTDERGESQHRVAHTDALGACLAFFMSGAGRAFVARHGLSPQMLFDTLPATVEHSAHVEGPGFRLDIERLH